MKTIFFIASLLIINCLPAKAQGVFGKTYKKGYYYNLNNEKIVGLVNFSPYSTSFYYKRDEDAKWEKIKINMIRSIVTTERTTYYRSGFNTTKAVEKYVDSFSVKSINREGKNPYLAKLVFQNPEIKIYIKTKRPQNSAPSMSVTNSATGGMAWKDGAIGSPTTIFMFEKDNVTFELTKKNYKAILSSAFANDPKMLKRITESEFKDLNNILYPHRVFA